MELIPGGTLENNVNQPTVIGGMHGVRATRVMLTLKDGTTADAVVDSGRISPGDTIFWALLDSPPVRATAYDAAVPWSRTTGGLRYAIRSTARLADRLWMAGTDCRARSLRWGHDHRATDLLTGSRAETADRVIAAMAGPDARLREDQATAVAALVRGRRPGPGRAGHRLGQVGGLLGRHRGPPLRGRRPDAGGLPAAVADARPGRGRGPGRADAPPR